jgi:hypothetical protein
MPQDIMLTQPVRLQIGGGVDDKGGRKPSKVFFLSPGLNRNVPDEVAEHPYIKLHLSKVVPAEKPKTMFSAQQIQMIDQLGLSPQQRQMLDRMQLTPEQQAVSGQTSDDPATGIQTGGGKAAEPPEPPAGSGKSKK